MKIRAHVFIYGDVTGVGFRFWTKNLAEKMGLTGWVRNLDSHTVEAIFQGEKEKVKEIIKLCHHGPEISWVKKVDAVFTDKLEKLDGFEIRY